MSHLSRMRLHIKSKADLVESAKAIGLEAREQTSFKWYSGRAACQFALGIPGDKDSYEIGVVSAPAGQEGFDLQFDGFGQAKMLALLGGPNFDRLKQEYAATVALRKAKSQLAHKGFVVKREALANGRIRIAARRR